MTKVLDITPNSILLLENNKTRLVPTNTFNTLKYIVKKDFEGMVGHTKVYLGENCIISPTTQEFVFCMEYDGNLVHTAPDNDREVYKAILEAYSNNNHAPFISLFKRLYEKQQKEEYIELILSALGKKVERKQHGCLVDQRFFVAQNGNAYKVKENGEMCSLCIVPRDHNIRPKTLEYKGIKIVLGQQEQIFLSKILMLLEKEKYRSDNVFWRQIS